MRFIVFSCKANSPRLKRNLISSIGVASQVAVRLKSQDLRILDTGNKIWMHTGTSVQSLFRKLIFGDRGQNLRQRRYQNCVVLSNFARFSYFWPSVLSLIFCKTNSLHIITHPSLLQTLISEHFQQLQSHCQAFNENINKMSCGKVSNRSVFCRQYFSCLLWF